MGEGQFLLGQSDPTCPLEAKAQLCGQLPQATLAALEAAATPGLPEDFRTILD